MYMETYVCTVQYIKTETIDLSCFSSIRKQYLMNKKIVRSNVLFVGGF